MNHFKLVALAESPTRYTKVIRVPGADTKYNRRYEATGYVSRYTKSVAPPASYVPPGPDFEPLEIAPNQGSNWLASNVYEVGKTIEARTAAYTGGLEPVSYRCRFQWKPKGTTSWVDGQWMDTENEKTSFFFECTEEEELKFQTQARDSSDPVVQLNSTTGVKTCKGIGDITATVFGNPYDLVAAPALTILTLDPIPVAIQKSGASDVTYSWSVRGDAGVEFSNPIGASTDVTIATAGVVTVTCTIQSLGEVKRVDIQFFGVTAETWDTINLYCHEVPTFSATDGCNAGSVLSVTSFGDTLPKTMQDRYFWEACGAGKDQSVENNWSSRSSDADYVVDDYDFNHGFSFRLSVQNVAAEPLSTGYEKIIYCNSSVMQFDEN